MRISLLIMTLFLIPYCGKKDKNPKITVEIAPEEGQLLETSTFSCFGKIRGTSDGKPDLIAPTVTFKKIEIKWESDNPLYIGLIKIVFKGAALSGGEFTCTFNSDEIEILLGHNEGDNVNFKENTLTKRGTYLSRSDCRISCGGFKLNDANNLSVSLTGQIFLKGTEEDVVNEKFSRVSGIGHLRVIP